MLIPLSQIPVGSCFLQGRKLRKKIGDDNKVATFGKGRRVNTHKTKGDPQVEQTTCPLRMLAVGLRRHPDVIVEIGDGNLLNGPTGGV